MVYGRSVLTTIGVLGFFAMLSVESTIIPLGDLILEHRMYLPLAGLALAFVAWCYASPKRAIVMHLTFLVVVGGLAYGTYQRNMVYQSRISLWKDVTVQFPNKGRGLVGLANAYLDEGDVLRAMKNCREALRVNPNNAAAYLALGRIHRDLDNHKLALFYFTKAATLEPWRNDYLYEQGVALRQQGEFQSALDVFNKIIHSAPRMARAYSQRGGIYESRGETLLALADYNKALEYNPYDIEAYNQRGWFHIEQENFKDGVIDFNKMIDLQPRSVVAYNNRGLSLLRMKQYALALKDLNTAVSFGPQIGQLYVNRGQVHEELKNWRQAREDYLRAIELNPQDPAGYIQIGLLDMKFRNFEVALRRLDQAVDLQPDASYTRYHRALLYYATERYAEAYQDLMAANRAGYAPAKDFLPKVTPQISTPLTEKP